MLGRLWSCKTDKEVHWGERCLTASRSGQIHLILENDKRRLTAGLVNEHDVQPLR